MAESSTFLHYLRDRYLGVKSQHPTEGRHQLRLRIVEDFWKLSSEARSALYPNVAPLSETEIASAPFSTDVDPLDAVAAPDAPWLGIIVRTDYTNDAAWKTFHATLLEAEKDFVSDVESPPGVNDSSTVPSAPNVDDNLASLAGLSLYSSSTPTPPTTTYVNMAEPENENEGEGEEEEEEEEESLVFFSIFAPSEPREQAHLTSVSNLTALRLLNGVSIRSAPSVPVGTKRIKPGSRLVDLDGLQEIYTGKMLWIYDTRSNEDQCVRLVSQQGSDLYGTATADSWRARASHITELQVNLASGAMKIDFGGLDRWDYPERKRNLEEGYKSIVF